MLPPTGTTWFARVRNDEADTPAQLAAVSAQPAPGGQREDDGALPAVSAVA
jgi:hypothetical protein